MKKIGIITLFYKNYNYGGLLQTYALQKKLNVKNSCCVIKVDRSKAKKFISPNDSEILTKKSNINFFVNKVNHIVYEYNFKKISCGLERRKNAFDKFSTQNIITSSFVFDDNNIAATNEQFDIFITGSDQVFSKTSGRDITFLNFVEESKVKASYAASIGMDTIPNDYLHYIEEKLADFDYISVREKTAKFQLKDKVKNVVEVLDPTMLLTLDDWENLEEPCSELQNKEFIFCYLLGRNEGERTVAHQFSKSVGLPIATIPYGMMVYSSVDKKFGVYKMISASPGQFLWLIHHAKYVLTDSFHGTVFSILYHKCFVVMNRTDSKILKQNSRMIDLLEKVKLSNRMVSPNLDNLSTQIAYEIDWDEVENQLAVYRKDSLNFLDCVVNTNK